MAGLPNVGGGPPTFQGGGPPTFQVNRPAPIGGGEFVQERGASSSNRIDPAQMPRPIVGDQQQPMVCPASVISQHFHSPAD